MREFLLTGTVLLLALTQILNHSAYCTLTTSINSVSVNRNDRNVQHTRYSAVQCIGSAVCLLECCALHRLECCAAPSSLSSSPSDRELSTSAVNRTCDTRITVITGNSNNCQTPVNIGDK